MQICPGDLLVYSKQLIDRMNQSNEIDTPDFLTIDDKKGKNIWSSFKLVSDASIFTINQTLTMIPKTQYHNHYDYHFDAKITFSLSYKFLTLTMYFCVSFQQTTHFNPQPTILLAQ